MTYTQCLRNDSQRKLTGVEDVRHIGLTRVCPNISHYIISLRGLLQYSGLPLWGTTIQAGTRHCCVTLSRPPHSPQLSSAKGKVNQVMLQPSQILNEIHPQK